MSLPKKIEIEYFDEVSRTITYDFQVTIKGKSFSGYVTGNISWNEIIAEHSLRWETPGHPEFDEQETHEFIAMLFDIL